MGVWAGRPHARLHTLISLCFSLHLAVPSDDATFSPRFSRWLAGGLFLLPFLRTSSFRHLVWITDWQMTARKQGQPASAATQQERFASGDVTGNDARSFQHGSYANLCNRVTFDSPSGPAERRRKPPRPRNACELTLTFCYGWLLQPACTVVVESILFLVWFDRAVICTFEFLWSMIDGSSTRDFILLSVIHWVSESLICCDTYMFIKFHFLFYILCIFYIMFYASYAFLHKCMKICSPSLDIYVNCSYIASVVLDVHTYICKIWN